MAAILIPRQREKNLPRVFACHEVRISEATEKPGAGEGNRTPDLRFTKPLLYRLSYAGGLVKLEKNAHPARA